MQLVHDIIDVLSSSKPDLADALSKAQVVAYKLGEQNLGAWVRSELVGYAADAEIPEYRLLPITVYGTVANVARRYTNYRLPTFGVPDELRDELLIRRIDKSISVIEGWAASGQIQSSLGPEHFHFFMEGIDPSYQIESAYGAFNAGAFTQIVVEVRSRLLDLMLSLSDKLPESEAADVKAMAKEINVNDLFKGAVFGDGATLNLAVGANNTATQDVRQNIEKGDKESLLRELSKHAVQGTDAQKLEAAIVADDGAADHTRREFGPAVRGWLGQMLSKAGTTGFSLSTQTAAGVLAAALSKYYGFN